MASPFVYKDREEDSMETRLWELAPMSANGVRVSSEELFAMRDKEAVFETPQHLLLNIKEDELTEVDAFLDEYLYALANTDAKYLILIAEEPRSAMPLSNANYRRMLTTSDSVEEGTEFSDYKDGTYLYLTPELMAGILTGFFCTVVTLIGLSCLNDILTPDEFAKVKIPLGKEF
jgi:hypothetical protein